MEQAFELTFELKVGGHANFRDNKHIQYGSENFDPESLVESF